MLAVEGIIADDAVSDRVGTQRMVHCVPLGIDRLQLGDGFSDLLSGSLILL